MNKPKGQNPVALAKIIMINATFWGRASMLAFVLFLLVGPFDAIEIKLPYGGWIFWDLFLSSLFFLQHSGMMRRSFRAWMAHAIPTYFHGAIFTLASSLALIVLVFFWQPSHIQLIDPAAPMRWLTYGLFFLAAAGTGWGVWSLKHFDPFGRGPIKRHLSGEPLPSYPFTLKGPYLWVRHPLYFFVLVMIWSRADLTADRLLFNLVWSSWIYVGTILEERDLVSEFGDHYRHYQKQVPMLIPWKGIKANRNDIP